MGRVWASGWWGIVAALLGAAPCVLAQSSEEPLAAAIAVLEAEGAPAAAPLLEALVAEAPGYATGVHGSAAYWLGLALWQQDEPAAAVAAWQNGFQALLAAGRLDVPLADAVARYTSAPAVGPVPAAYEEAAAQAYLQLVRLGPRTLGPDLDALVDRHLARLSWILPPDVQARTGLAAAATDTSTVPPLPPEGVADLIAWWRRQDPLPATAPNERLNEHLRRVAHAEAHYAPGGVLDARAQAYVRFGPPTRQTTIDFSGRLFERDVILRNSAVTRLDFPANEFWLYDHLGRPGQYLFVERDGRFEEALPHELLPLALRGGYARTRRGARKGESALRTLEEVYRQLATYHDDFAFRYNDIANYLGEVEANKSPTEREQMTTLSGSEIAQAIGRERFETSGGRPYNSLDEQLAVFAQSTVSSAATEERRAARERERHLPPADSGVLRGVDRLEADVRIARFREPNGSTRVEAYWAHPPGAFEVPRRTRRALAREGVAEDGHVVALTAVVRGPDYAALATGGQRYAAAQPEGQFPVQTLTLAAPDGPFHLALQWDQVAPSTSGAERRVKVGTFYADSLRALGTGPAALGMSDLRPVLLQPDGDVPYPFRAVTRQAPLGFYFEAYGLAFDAEDRTRYTVAYEVRRPGTDGRLLAAETAFEGTATTARELIGVDPSQWQEPGPVEVTIRVTDEVTGAEAERSVRFDLVGG